MVLPLPMPYCTKGAVFSWGKRNFKASSSTYDLEARELVITLVELEPDCECLEISGCWLAELGRAYAEEFVEKTVKPMEWASIEVHIDVEPPQIIFCL
jgi:hypothetical protein